jgi:hypothetical protein
VPQHLLRLPGELIHKRPSIADDVEAPRIYRSTLGSTLAESPATLKHCALHGTDLRLVCGPGGP